VPEREVAAEMLRRVELDGYTVIADKGFAGEEFEQLMAELGAIFLRPDRKDEQPRFGGLGGVRAGRAPGTQFLPGPLVHSDLAATAALAAAHEQ
jgi:hypothetical protein